MVTGVQTCALPIYCRDLEYVRRTRSERKRALLEEMRLENERLMREETARAVRQAELAAEHALSN